MKTIKTQAIKRLLSILIFLSLLLPMLSGLSLPTFAASASGTSESDPCIVTNYAEFKEAMGNKNIYFVQVGDMDEFILQRGNLLVNGIEVLGEKTLILRGNTILYSPVDEGFNKIDSLLNINPNNSLTVKGNGTLTFKASINNGNNAVIHINGGTLLVEGGARLVGDLHTAVYCRAIAQSYGSLTINSGTFIGKTAYTNTKVFSTVAIKTKSKTVINGGTFLADTVEGNAQTSALTISEGLSGVSVKINGGKFTSGNGAGNYSIAVVSGHGNLSSSTMVSDYIYNKDELYMASDPTRRVSTNVSGIKDSVIIKEKRINSVLLFVPPVEAGSIADKARTTTENITIGLTEWIHKDKMTIGDKLELGETYKCYVIVYIDDPYEFSDTLEVRLNGKVANIESDGPGYVVVSYTFTEIDKEKAELLDTTLKNISVSMSPGGSKENYRDVNMNPIFDPKTREYTIIKGENTIVSIHMDRKVEGQTITATINGENYPLSKSTIEADRYSINHYSFKEATTVIIVTVKAKNGSNTDKYTIIISDGQQNIFTLEPKDYTGYAGESTQYTYTVSYTGNVEYAHFQELRNGKWEKAWDMTKNYKNPGTYTIHDTLSIPRSTLSRILYRIDGKDHYSNEFTLTFIKKDGPAAPTGLVAVNPTAEGKADGKIIGTTNLMEYAENIEFTVAKDCQEKETTGLKAGGYYIRFKATEAQNPSKHIAITIGEVPLKFTKISTFDIAESIIGKEIEKIDVSIGAIGGKKPYKFIATSLPTGITISKEGIISGKPTTESSGGTATITVTDSGGKAETKNITINYGKISKELLVEEDKLDISKDNINKDYIDKAIKDAIKDKDGNPIINITLDKPITEKGVDVTITPEGIDSLAKTINSMLSINVGSSSLTFDNAAISEIKKQSSNKAITFHMSIADKTKLNLNQKATVGENMVYELSVISDGKAITEFNGNVMVSLPYTPKVGENLEAIVIYYVDAKGAIQVIRNGKYDAKLGTVIFTTNHFSFYMIKNNYVKFSDIKDNHWAKPAIDFASSRGLVIGVGENKYNPSGTLTRAQLIQMIQNVLNLPVAKKDIEAYGDVESKSWFYGPIMSAKSAGLLKGIKLDVNKFMPNQPITREEMALILANTAIYKKASIPGEKIDLTKFKDYKEINKDFADQIIIAMNLGLLSKEGKGNGTFAPKATTTRAEAAQVQINLFKALRIVD